MTSRFDNESPLFRALGIPEVDNSAAELGFCRTIVKAHLNKYKTGNIDEESVKILVELTFELVHTLGQDYCFD